MNEQTLTTSQINSQIRAAGFDWEADDTAISKLSKEDQKLHLGLEVREEDTERVESILSAEPLVRELVDFAPRSDWREKDGQNWVTEVQDQGNCGSCVSFATVATIESQAKIQYEEPSWNVDLSEADLFFCGAGRKCNEGWWPALALDYAKERGVPGEDCFPYEDENMDCSTCTDRDDHLIKIGDWQEIIRIDERKEWLDKSGPLVACMAVYRDFFNYRNGVYRHVTGDLAGYHAICCVGYDEDDDCWICKNSWGYDWGNSGFFKIAYGQADIDTRFAMYGVKSINGTLRPPDVEDSDIAEHLVFDNSFEANRRVLWAYVKGQWRYKLVSDAQAMGLGSTLFQSDKVEAFFKGDKLTRIRGWK